MKLLIADDHLLFRDSLQTFMQRQASDFDIAYFSTFDSVRDHLKEDPAQDLVILDMFMPGMNTLEGLRELRSAYPSLRLAIMSGVARENEINEALEIGACGFFPKVITGKDFLDGIKSILKGEIFIPVDPTSNARIPSAYCDSTHAKSTADLAFHVDDFGLTPREKAVLLHLMSGISNKEIANFLDVQEVTIKFHVGQICKKLGVRNRTQAALKASEMKFEG